MENERNRWQNVHGIQFRMHCTENNAKYLIFPGINSNEMVIFQAISLKPT